MKRVTQKPARLRFAPLSPAEVADALMQHHEYEEAQARAAAADADGSIGRALAAEVLAYAANKQSVVMDLVYAMRDPAGDVRNNATRALALTKQALGWTAAEPFHVPDEALARWREGKPKGAALHAEWDRALAAYRGAHPDLARELERRLRGEHPAGWERAIPEFTAENGNVASRAASGVVLNALAAPKESSINGLSIGVIADDEVILIGTDERREVAKRLITTAMPPFFSKNS